MKALPVLSVVAGTFVAGDVTSAGGDTGASEVRESTGVSGGVVVSSGGGKICGPVVGPGVKTEVPDQRSGSIRRVRGCV